MTKMGKKTSLHKGEPHAIKDPKIGKLRQMAASQLLCFRVKRRQEILFCKTAFSFIEAFNFESFYSSCSVTFYLPLGSKFFGKELV